MKCCPEILSTGDPCGRAIDEDYPFGLCEWHSREKAGLRNAETTAIRGYVECVTPGCKGEQAYRKSGLCRCCQSRWFYQHVPGYAEKRRAQAKATWAKYNTPARKAMKAELRAREAAARP